MRTSDRLAFARAANVFDCWILVRQTNQDSLQYIGQGNYAPKPIDCKAKTADNSQHRLSGLVVDPMRVPLAFSTGRLEKAKAIWASDFLPILRSSGQYGVVEDETSPHYGCVTFIPLDHTNRNLASVEELRGQLHMRGPLLLKVQQFINDQIGVEMVQHGGEAQYAGHSDEPIDAFGPGMQYLQFLNGLAVESWYRQFNRPTLDHSSMAAPASAGPWVPRVIPGGRK
jgi:hypothetical protein